MCVCVCVKTEKDSGGGGGGGGENREKFQYSKAVPTEHLLASVTDNQTSADSLIVRVYTVIRHVNKRRRL